ncbi:9713_t:CDS:10 [Diversispora eburnea]|uniref:9713_t:CDS:1 n=1 Tax=Diversispora eburnea TaxID=1213867 RepID=A0A9N9FIP2_9GLOM|nr:9713_t:CDS:10 [Diversispora eburnea]
MHMVQTFDASNFHHRSWIWFPVELIACASGGRRRFIVREGREEFRRLRFFRRLNASLEMCGILFSLERRSDTKITLSDNNYFHDELWNRLIIQNKNRGPDSQELFPLSFKSSIFPNNGIFMEFYGAVLHLRGERVIKQPFISDDQDILLLNGEIFDGLNVPTGENDTIQLIKALKENEKQDCVTDKDDYCVLSILQKIEGPYSIVYWQNSKRKLWFGRDCLGRRSLLWNIPFADENFLLTSVGCKIPNEFLNTITTESYLQEVPADGIYCLNVGEMLSSNDMSGEELFRVGKESLSSKNPINVIRVFIFNFMFRAIRKISKTLQKLPFDKLNNAIPNQNELSVLPELLADIPLDSIIPPISSEMKLVIDQMIDELSDSVRRRVVDIPRIGSKRDARVAIMFSGGLDCICLAALADKFISPEESIDLINVAFENPRIQQAKSGKKKKNVQDVQSIQGNTNSIYDVPDRITGRQGVIELRKISPNRTWNFIEVNVSYNEACEYKNEILKLMAPSDTIMDLSIAMAFWFAVRGKGQIKCLVDGSEKMVDHESKARVVLVGVGADELLAGYSRHREAFKQGGWEKLIEEVQLDVNRISKRNLDDRIISSHAKESRFPYLSTKVVSFLCSLPIHFKADMRYPRGIGEKLLLRHVARKLGLLKASVLYKRAIQFGARTAKMTIEQKGERGNMKVIDE